MRLALCLLLVAMAQSLAAAEPGAPRTLEWTDLIPESARGEFSSGPATAAHDYLGEGGPAAVQQSLNAPVNTELEGKAVKINRTQRYKNLGAGQHTIKIQVVNTDGSYVVVDAFDVR